MYHCQKEMKQPRSRGNWRNPHQQKLQKSFPTINDYGKAEFRKEFYVTSTPPGGGGLRFYKKKKKKKKVLNERTYLPMYFGSFPTKYAPATQLNQKLSPFYTASSRKSFEEPIINRSTCFGKKQEISKRPN